MRADTDVKAILGFGEGEEYRLAYEIHRKLSPDLDMLIKKVYNTEYDEPKGKIRMSAPAPTFLDNNLLIPPTRPEDQINTDDIVVPIYSFKTKNGQSSTLVHNLLKGSMPFWVPTDYLQVDQKTTLDKKTLQEWLRNKLIKEPHILRLKKLSI